MNVSVANLRAIAASGSATATSTALLNAARHIESIQMALITEQELTERFTWLLEHPDEFCSAVNDAYGQWGGENAKDFADILGDEIKRQMGKARPSPSPGAKHE